MLRMMVVVVMMAIHHLDVVVGVVVVAIDRVMMVAVVHGLRRGCAGRQSERGSGGERQGDEFQGPSPNLCSELVFANRYSATALRAVHLNAV